MKPWLSALVCLGLSLAGTTAQSDAASAKIIAFTPTTASIAFSGLTFAASQASTLIVTTFTLNFRTSGTPGTIAITAPTINGTAGNSIPQAAFLAKCTRNADPNGDFTTSGVVRLGAAPVTCGTVVPGISDTFTFDVTITIDGSADASSFTGDAYTSGSLIVTATLP